MIKFALSLLLAATFSTSIAVAQENDDPSDDVDETANSLLIRSASFALVERADLKCDCSSLLKYEKCVNRLVKENLAAYKASAKFLKVSKQIKQEIILTQQDLRQGCEDLLNGDNSDEDPDENLN
jgi:hypothetical protein